MIVSKLTQGLNISTSTSAVAQIWTWFGFTTCLALLQWSLRVFSKISFISVVQISGWVFTLLHFSIGSVWFSRGRIANKLESIITTCLHTFLSDSAKHRQCYLQFSVCESSDLEKLSTQKYDDIFMWGGYWITWISRTVVICSWHEKINLVENRPPKCRVENGFRQLNGIQRCTANCQHAKPATTSDM